MSYPTLAQLVGLVALFAEFALADSTAACPPEEGVALQVLGSGGPIADDNRASSGYLVWIDGKSRILIDAGGGAFLRFGEAGASFADLDFVGLSHFHTDHSADFPALLKSGNFSGRQRALSVAGPGGRGRFPGLAEFLERMLNGGSGAYGYLGGYLSGTDGLAKLETIEIDASGPAALPQSGDERSGFTVRAMRVPHGIVPSVAYRVATADTALVFASDQNGNDAEFVDFAAGADVLVMHMAVPLKPDRVARELHAPPDLIGNIAAESGVTTLVLSHFMARSLRALETNVDAVRAGFDGDIVAANDLDCIVVRAR